ncbi:hypothetical protein HYU92_06795 [Candidatus Curtissbacteria bacterium]|nr:hypothetical protein [Candidatus Curtissbacteria bacterium]
MRRVHLILSGLSLTIVALSLNRLTPFTQGYLQPFEFLRWLDFNAMLPIPLVSIVLYYLLKREIVSGSPFIKTRLYSFLSVILVAGIYFFGAGSGDHEVTNYLHFRFCNDYQIDNSLCNIVFFNDDRFSHYVYYLGFVLLNVSLMIIEFKSPRKVLVSLRDLFAIAINSLVIAFGIFANLAFEEALIDLLVFGSVMLLALYLLFLTNKKLKSLPITYYFAVSYSVGVVGTIFYKLVTNTPFY